MKRLIVALFLIGILTACGHQQSTSPVKSITVTAQPVEGVVSTMIPTTGCGKASPVPSGETADATITSGGQQRTYRLHVPTAYNPDQPLPLVFNIHGHGETALQQERYTRYSELADQHHFLVVYPQGVIGPDGKLGWATYGKNSSHVDDILFFSDLLTTLQGQLCVDAHRIYATGISNGGGMTNLLACQMAGRITAVAPVAAAIYPIPGGCHPARPVPYLEFHGTGDPVVHYTGSTTLQFQPIMQIMQDWAIRDGCSNNPTTFFQQADVTGFQWNNCHNGVLVEHYRIAEGGHTWPGASIPTPLGATTHTISATTLSWHFFQQYRLP